MPTPVTYTPTGQGNIRLDTGDWVVIYTSDDVMSEAQYLAGGWRIVVHKSDDVMSEAQYLACGWLIVVHKSDDVMSDAQCRNIHTPIYYTHPYILYTPLHTHTWWSVPLLMAILMIADIQNVPLNI